MTSLGPFGGVCRRPEMPFLLLYHVLHVTGDRRGRLLRGGQRAFQILNDNLVHAVAPGEGKEAQTLVKGFGQFQRDAGGGVTILKAGAEFGDRETILDLTGSAWASIVAHVSARGETGDTYREALEFHEKAEEPAHLTP